MRYNLYSSFSRRQPSRLRVAVVGSGISGLSAAWHLRQHARVTLFEADHHLGGHANTVDITLDTQTFAVDTGFLVCNHKTYPGLMPFFETLGVALAKSKMGFSVQVRNGDGHSVREWAGTGLAGLFAQQNHIVNRRFWGMLKDILRFNRLATQMSLNQDLHALTQSTGAFLAQQGFGQAFRDDYLVPMVACIWSCSAQQMMDFPVGTLIAFCHNHGLLQVLDQPQWYTVAGGSREYVKRVAAQLEDVRLGCPVVGVDLDLQGPRVQTAYGVEHFDAVVLACHSGQSLQLLGTHASATQKRILGAVRYQPNRAVLHTDTSLLPQRRAAWAAWNYETTAGDMSAPHVCLHYWLNALQPLPTSTPVIVSLNPIRQPRADLVHAAFDYAHPIFDHQAIAAQRSLDVLQQQSRQSRIWFAGAWMGYGFHEDGFQAGRRAATDVAQTLGLALEHPIQPSAEGAEHAVAA